jgi:hypothetical protein
MTAFVLALAAEELTLWRIIVGVGAVVIAVVILLLTFLLRVVREIDTGVGDVLAVAGGVVTNTVNLEALETTLAGCEAIREEVRLHNEHLGSVL